MKPKILITSFVVTLLLATLAHAVFVLPSQITVAGRIDGGQLKTDVVQDGSETIPTAPPAELIFSENFDSQPDWATTGRRALPPNLPVGWDFARTDEAWHPADGDVGTQPSMMINGNDPGKVYGETGKAFISYSESNNPSDDNGWESDGFIGRDIPPTDELFVRFKIKFQPGFATTFAEAGQIKLFRVLSWDGPSAGNGSRNHFGSSGNSAPIYFYDWNHGSYGLRHFHAFRCDAQTSNYFCTNPLILNPPRQIINGDMSGNYSSNIALFGAQLPDLVNGGLLPTDPYAIISHNQVLGDAWHTVEFHLKLNTQAGVQDGVLQHWLDGEKLVSMQGIAWIGTGGNMNARWNSFSIGGNDHFHFDLTGAPANRERWYAIDDVEVYNAVPQDRQ